MWRLTVPTATLLLILYTLLYILPFYLSPLTRPSPLLSRDSTAVIQARIRSVSISCAISTIITFGILTSTFGSTTAGVLHSLRLMGWWPIQFYGAIQCLALTVLLFMGPLYESRIAYEGWYEWVTSTVADVKEVLGSWTGWRNFVAGPITEEVLFRSCALPLFILATTTTITTTTTIITDASSPPSLTILLLTPPLIFGLAHIHHYYEFRLSNPRVPFTAALLRSLFQFGYTTLFGAYATFLYLRTGSLLGVVLVHSFCNWMGLPRVWGRVEGPEPRLMSASRSGLDVSQETVMGPDAGRGGMAFFRAQQDGARQERGGGWTVAYYVLLVVGAVAFWNCSWSFTESEGALIDFG